MSAQMPAQMPVHWLLWLLFLTVLYRIFISMKLSLALSAVLGLGFSVLSATSAQASADITLINGALNTTVTYEELKMLADTGVADGNLVLVLDDADETPEAAREFLNQRIEYKLTAADALFNNGEGEALLDKLAKVIMPRNTTQDAKQALRSAIVTSLQDDNALTPLEIVANFPVDAQVDVIRLREASASYAGLDKVMALLQSTQAMSKADKANQELNERFAQVEVRKQERMQAMWSGVSAPRQVAADVVDTNEPIRGLW